MSRTEQRGRITATRFTGPDRGGDDRRLVQIDLGDCTDLTISHAVAQELCAALVALLADGSEAPGGEMIEIPIALARQLYAATWRALVPDGG